jgi:molecular chaperone GrpE
MFKDKNKDKHKDRQEQAPQDNHDKGQENKTADVNAMDAEIKVLRDELSKKDDNQDKVLRLQAEFDNFRKRSIKERQEFIKYANEGLIIELVGMLDNFERSIKAADQKQDFKLLHQGVDMISKQLHKLLEEKGLRKINSIGEKFDPNKHEAIEAVVTQETEEGYIIEEFQPGYILNERVIRPAMVKVAKGMDIVEGPEAQKGPAKAEEDSQAPEQVCPESDKEKQDQSDEAGQVKEDQ